MSEPLALLPGHCERCGVRVVLCSGPFRWYEENEYGDRWPHRCDPWTSVRPDEPIRLYDPARAVADPQRERRRNA